MVRITDTCVSHRDRRQFGTDDKDNLICKKCKTKIIIQSINHGSKLVCPSCEGVKKKKE